MRRDIVVMGASAGGIEALKEIVAALPRDFPAALFVVTHTSPDSPGVLGGILERAGELRAMMVDRRQRIEPGTIYIPCPDHHLLVEPSVARATKGPRENRFRPAVDPLFRSAAQTYGPRVIGVILTGGLDDGTAGLWAVKQMGGIAVVQDPEDAAVDSMPRNAIAHVKVDHCVPLAQIAPLLQRLTAEDIAEIGGYKVPDPMHIEVNIAGEHEAVGAGVRELGTPSHFACPECHGVLLQLKEGERVRFRCHTGHAYSPDSLISEFDDAIEIALWSAVRALTEKYLFVRDLADYASESADPELAQALAEQAEAAHQRSEMVRQAAMTGVQAPGAMKAAADGGKRNGAADLAAD